MTNTRFLFVVICCCWQLLAFPSCLAEFDNGDNTHDENHGVRDIEHHNNEQQEETYYEENRQQDEHYENHEVNDQQREQDLDQLHYEHQDPVHDNQDQLQEAYNSNDNNNNNEEVYDQHYEQHREQEQQYDHVDVPNQDEQNYPQQDDNQEVHEHEQQHDDEEIYDNQQQQQNDEQGHDYAEPSDQDEEYYDQNYDHGGVPDQKEHDDNQQYDNEEAHDQNEAVHDQQHDHHQEYQQEASHQYEQQQHQDEEHNYEQHQEKEYESGPEGNAGGDEYVHVDPTGVDVDWPMHYPSSRHPDANRRKNMAERYQQFLYGCSFINSNGFSEEDCNRIDRERMTINRMQPPTIRNYTVTGFEKVGRAPTRVLTSVLDFYDKYHTSHMVREAWPPGSMYANHWASVIKTLPIEGFPHAEGSKSESNSVSGGQPSLSAQQRRELIALVQPIVEKWCKASLVPTAIQGIREYRRGALVVPAVNRLPFVITAVINVAQSVVDDWPLQVITHDGKAVNVTMRPGDMVIYEGASVIHGRPYALNGQIYSELQLHFEPVGYSQYHAMNLRQDPKKLFDAALQKHHDAAADSGGRNEKKNVLPYPYYVLPKYADQWDQKYVFVKRPTIRRKKPNIVIENLKVTSLGGNEKKSSNTNVDENEYEVDGRLFHNLAAKGYLVQMKKLVAKDPSIVNKVDSNGWTALHEAARSGHTRVVEYLCGLMDQTEINTRTNGGIGGSPLWWALHMFSEDHPVVKVLLKHGAKSIPPHAARETKSK